MNLQHLTSILASWRYRYESEAELRDGIEDALQDAAIPFSREVPLTAGRLDFLVGDIAIEVKTRGGRSDLVRQVMRYAEDPQIAAVLVVTTRLQHRLPPTMAGKSVRVLSLPRAFA